ncbi:MAG TPA: SpoVR family protein [bacterium]|nr:SpoVR family protein [bacterium]
MNLSPALSQIKDEIKGHALSYGLDFFETIFEMIDYAQINEVASYGGFPTRYPHWRFGMEYEELSKGYAYGLQKIYEMVINNDPCYAYLMESNNLVDQKIVMGHVYAHCDFFKNNIYFSGTNRKMIDEMANHGMRIRNYVEQFGEEDVERFVDCCLSLENLIDVHSPFLDRKRRKEDSEITDEESPKTVQKIRSKEYMDRFINPEEFMESQKRKLEEEKQRERMFPEHPERDILLFLIEHAPLDKWQRNILSLIREESYYFSPQAQTKIMNEGWATYWHSKIMTEKALKDSELIDYADHHSGTLAVRPGHINPYKLGVELFRDIEDRWNKGKFGKEYEECDDYLAKKSWNQHLGRGREKVFEVRRIYNDINFIDTFLTKEFCEDHRLFTYKFNEESKRYEIEDRDFKKIKQKLLFSLTNMGSPIILVEDGNHGNRGELLLHHQYEGVDLRIDYAKDTLRNLFLIWRRPVHINTVVEGRKKRFSFTGQEHMEKDV